MCVILVCKIATILASCTHTDFASVQIVLLDRMFKGERDFEDKEEQKLTAKAADAKLHVELMRQGMSHAEVKGITGLPKPVRIIRMRDGPSLVYALVCLSRALNNMLAYPLCRLWFVQQEGLVTLFRVLLVLGRPDAKMPDGSYGALR